MDRVGHSGTSINVNLSKSKFRITVILFHSAILLHAYRLFTKVPLTIIMLVLSKGWLLQKGCTVYRPTKKVWSDCADSHADLGTHTSHMTYYYTILSFLKSMLTYHYETVQYNLVISNNRLSRSENLVPDLTWKSNNR